MSEAHEKLPKLFWVQLALAAIVGILFFVMPSKDHASTNIERVEEAAKNLSPVGAVSTTVEVSKPSKTRTGEEVYNASCQACHATGVANAPKIDDKAAWEPRVSAGLDSLMHSALNGKGAMPARGGNPAITDDEIKATILYMANKAGLDLGAGKVTKTVANKTEEPKVEVKTMPKTVAVADPSVKIKEPVAPKAPTEPAASSATDSKAENKAVAFKGSDNKEGEKVYRNSCFACHDMGIAGSPKLGDKAAWGGRITTGKDSLYKSAINGKGAMPAKGGNTSLSDDAVTAAVDYMVSKAQ